MEVAKKVVLNTGFLYGKMLVTMVISLFSTRIILDALGVDDFGIFNIVAGVIGMLNFLNSAMTVSTQRYISFFIGANNYEKLKSVFFTSVILHLFIGIVVVIIFEIAGLFLFDNFLSIPADRISSAKLVYQFMVIGTFFTINAVPYDASIVAHEDLHFDAITGVIESIAKLGIAFWLVYTQNDKLVIYGLLMASLIVLIRITKSYYCYRNYEESRNMFSSGFDISLIKEMFSFAGWNMFGSFCHVLRNQGLAIVINIFFGVVINATYGIANQVNSQLSAFSTNMLKALNPQIIKSEGGNDRTRMLRLALVACKMSFFLMSFFAIPLILEMDYVLKLWLKTVPENSIVFCQLILILSLITQLTVGLRSAIQSTGIIKAYQMVVGILIMLNIPIAIVLIKLGFPSYSIFYGSIGLEVLAGVLRIRFAKKITKLNVQVFLNNVIFRSILVFSITFIIAYLPKIIIDQSIFRVLITILTSSLSIILLGKYILISKEEYRKIEKMILSFIPVNLRRK